MTAAKPRCMLGHEPLLALRRRGRKPVAGVLLDAGSCGPWLREATDLGCTSAMAAVWVAPSASPERFDLRCVHGLPVLLAVEAWQPKDRVRGLVQRVREFEPAALTLLRIGLDPADPWGSPMVPVDAFEVQQDGKPVRCCEQTAFLRACS